MDKILFFHQIGKDDHYNVWHTTGRNMLILMHSDGGRIVFNNASYSIQSGLLCFVGGEKLHYTLPDAPSTYDRSKLFIDANMLDTAIRLCGGGYSHFGELFNRNAAVCARLSGADLAEATKLFEDASKYADQERYRLQAFLSNYLKLLILLDQNHSGKISHPSDPISRAIGFINDNLQKKLSIDEICSEIHISKYHFCRQFKSTVGITVMDYILKTRLAMAKSLLVSKDISISEISEECGFSSISFFCRVFKQENGISPLKYRRLNKTRD